MQHATTTLRQAFNPYIFTPSNQIEKTATFYNALDTEDFFDVASIVDVNENALLTLTSFFEESKILKTLSYTRIPAGKLYLNDRVILKFSLAKGYENHFVLLRGLLGFGKPPHVLVVAEPVDRTFVIEVTSEYAESVVLYFQKIFTWLAKEIKFKVALKEIIRLQEEARKIQQEAFEGLYASIS
jgi:hypothetical protein